MQFTNPLRNLGLGAALVLGAVVAAGCGNDDRGITGPATNEPAAPADQADFNLTLGVSSADAPAGSRVTVALKADREITALQGQLSFDPAKLRFVGQSAQQEANLLAMVNEEGAARGQLGLLTINPRSGLRGAISPLVFEVLAPNYAASLKYEMAVAARGETELRGRRAVTGARPDAALRTPAQVAKLGIEEWAAILDPSGDWRKDLAAGRPSLSPGQRGQGAISNIRYGDVNLSGTFTSLDVSIAGNAALGRAGNEIIIGTDSATGNNRDLVIAANVRPSAPVIGGTDPNKVLNALDVQGIQATFLTIDDVDAEGVVNTPIREADNAGCSNLVVPGGTYTGNITWDVPRPCFVLLEGVVRIGENTGVTGGDATLTIARNTLVRGSTTVTPSALYIQRQGRIIAIGTDAEPIEFSCNGPLAPGCWGGVFLAGNATVNEANAGTSPAITGRQTGGANQRQGEGGAPAFGGNNDADSSGVMRYVRIEGAGFLLSTDNELNCLTLGGVGYGTDIDHIECKRGSDDSFEWFGGTVDATYLVSIDNQDDAIDGSFGWNGRLQFALVRQASDADKAFEFDNTETPATYLNTPATTAELYNITVVQGATNETSDVMHLRRGTAPEIGNLLVLGRALHLDFDDNATSTRIGCRANTGSAAFSTDSLLVWRSRTDRAWAGNSDEEGTGFNACGFSGVTGSTPVTSFEAAYLDIPELLNDDTPIAAASDVLISPSNFANPDYRPRPGQLVVPSAASSLGMPGTRAGHINFVTSGAGYYGAVPPAAATLNNLPWYAGWTRW